MEITAEMVKTLRDRTDAGMMDCKKALKETAGDLEAAVAYLRQKGLAVASKRAGRTAAEGCVWAHVSPDHRSGVLLEVNCESDFVAKTDSFQELGSRLAEQLAAAALETVEELLAQGCPTRPNCRWPTTSMRSSPRPGKNARCAASAAIAATWWPLTFTTAARSG